jgi:anti-anti-sigma factor
MDAKHRGLRGGGGAVVDATPRSGRDTPRSPPRSLALARAQRERGPLTCGGEPLAESGEPLVPGQLTVRWERQNVTLIMWLSGTLDRATATLLDHELDGRAIGLLRLVVDLTGLEFVDSPGLDALVGVQWRASKRGDRLSFRHGQHFAKRPVALTRSVRLRSRWSARAERVSDEDSYFALAIACVNVDHPRSGDRPEAA